MRTKIAILHAAVPCAFLLPLGCAATYQDEMTFIKANDHIASGSTYRLAPPDRVRIHSPHAPEVDALARIRADGTVHLPLLGDVRLAGLTSREAAAKLQMELRDYYREPLVDVSVEQPVSKVFYLFGEVAGAGGAGRGRGGAARPLTGRDTLLDILTRNPPSQNAWLSQIKVIRPAYDPADNQEMVIDFHNMITTGDLRRNILLQEGDIVYVPPTIFAWIGYRINELLQPVQPVITAYTTPDTIRDAGDVYDDDDDGGDDRNINVGRIFLP